MKSCSLCDHAKDRFNDSSDLSYKENETVEIFYQKVKIIIMVSVSLVQDFFESIVSTHFNIMYIRLAAAIVS